MSRDRIIKMICAAQESTGIDPEADKWHWLTAAWRDAALFFQLRYEGEFTP